MEELNEMFENAKKDKKVFQQLKHLSITSKSYELAAKLKIIELQLFPETPEQKEAKERGAKLNTLLGMIELNIPDDVCWLIDAVIKMNDQKQDEFSLRDAVDMRAKRDNIFNT